VDQSPRQYFVDQVESATLSPAEKSKRDAEIVLDLLKNNKEFERIYNKNKQQKQRRESSQAGTPLSPLSPTQEAPPLPPRPPSRSPPPLEAEQEQALAKAQAQVQEDEQEEPIYETLLRNVHVPYKFSPVQQGALQVCGAGAVCVHPS